MKYLFPSALMLLFISCERPSLSIAGKGGKATLRISMIHDGNYADSGTVYIKYNSDDMPLANKFDDSAKFKLVDGRPRAVFLKLKTGKYFLFGTGYDAKHDDEIKGGAKYTITKETIIDYTLTTAH